MRAAYILTLHYCILQILCIVSPEGSINKISITANVQFPTPSVNDDLAVVYAKLSGEIYYFNEVECTNAFNLLR